MELPDNRRLRRQCSAYQILSAIVVFVILVCRSHSQKPQEAMNLLVTEERYWVPFYMPLYTFLQNLLNLLVHIASKIGLQKKNNNRSNVGNVILYAVRIVPKENRRLVLPRSYCFKIRLIKECWLADKRNMVLSTREALNQSDMPHVGS
jgi:hypothetical protein